MILLKKLVYCFVFLFVLIQPGLASESKVPYFSAHNVDSIEYDSSGNPVITEAGCIIWTNATLHYRYGFNRIGNVFVTLKNESGSVLDYGDCDLLQSETKKGYVTTMLNFGSYQPAGTYTLKYQIKYADRKGSEERQYLTATFYCNKSAIQAVTPVIKNTSVSKSQDTEYSLILNSSSQIEKKPLTDLEPEKETTFILNFIAAIAVALVIIILLLTRRNKEE